MARLAARAEQNVTTGPPGAPDPATLLAAVERLQHEHARLVSTMAVSAADADADLDPALRTRRKSTRNRDGDALSTK
jgi:hypothetical protein